MNDEKKKRNPMIDKSFIQNLTDQLNKQLIIDSEKKITVNRIEYSKMFELVTIGIISSYGFDIIEWQPKGQIRNSLRNPDLFARRGGRLIVVDMKNREFNLKNKNDLKLVKKFNDYIILANSMNEGFFCPNCYNDEIDEIIEWEIDECEDCLLKGSKFDIYPQCNLVTYEEVIDEEFQTSREIFSGPEYKCNDCGACFDESDTEAETIGLIVVNGDIKPEVEASIISHGTTIFSNDWWKLIRLKEGKVIITTLNAISFVLNNLEPLIYSVPSDLPKSKLPIFFQRPVYYFSGYDGNQLMSQFSERVDGIPGYVDFLHKVPEEILPYWIYRKRE